MTYKVIQGGTGSVGQAALAEMLTNPLFEVVGVNVVPTASNVYPQFGDRDPCDPDRL